MAADKAKATERALRLWRGASPVTADDPAGLYLARRCLAGLIGNPALRYRRDVPHPDRGRYPGLIALVTRVDGEPSGVHRTYLQLDGRKADADPVKVSLGPIWGSAIRLSEIDVANPLVIAEGLETAASAGRLLGYPAWAGISAGNVGKGLLLPPEARRLLIASDPDKPGRDAARNGWFRWRAEGREVQIAVPDGDGDFNDLLMRREVVHAR